MLKMFWLKMFRYRLKRDFVNKSSKGTYKIAVCVGDLALMPNALGAIAAQKNCRLGFTEWIFNEDEVRIELAREAFVRAKRKADAMAEAVGYEVIGIKSCSDVYNKLPKSEPISEDFSAMRMRRKIDIADIGAQFQHKNKVSAQVFVKFVISKNS